MIRGIYTNAASMLSLQLKQEVTANNLANANTTGFKKDGVFRKYLINHDTILRQNATDFRHLEDVDGVITNYSQGALYATGNKLDVALEGAGFFAVQTPNGERYTRNGSFTRDQNGYITTASGYFLLGANGPVQAQGQEVFIGDDGSVNVDGNMVDVLRIVDFPEPYRLNKIGDSLFEAEEGAARLTSTDQFRLHQGYLEQSNVETVEEMIKIIQVSRDFDSNQKSISMQDTTLDRAVNDIGRVTR